MLVLLEGSLESPGPLELGSSYRPLVPDTWAIIEMAVGGSRSVAISCLRLAPWGSETEDSGVFACKSNTRVVRKLARLQAAENRNSCSE